MNKLLAFVFLLNSISLWGQEQKSFPFDCLDSPVKIRPFKPWVSYNFKVFKDSTGKFEEYDKLSLILDRRVIVRYDYSIKGIRMYLYNPNDSVITLNSTLVSVKLMCEAIDTQGNWVEIEESQSIPFCGWGLYEPQNYVDVKKGEYIKLLAPCYTGSFKTQLRYKLTFGEKTKTTVYSEAFEGFINEGQLSWD